MIVQLPVLDVHLGVVIVEIVIVKKVVIDIIEIEKGREQEKENVIAVIESGNGNVNEEKGIEQFVKENVNVIDAGREKGMINHRLVNGNL